MAEAAAEAGDPAIAPGLTEGPRKPAGDWISDMNAEKNGENAPPAENAPAGQGEGNSARGNAQPGQGAGDSSQPEKPDGRERSLAAASTSASDDSGDLVEMLRGLESGDGGLAPDRALLAAEAVGALFSAPGGMSVRENAALVIGELERAGVDVAKMLASIAAVSARDRTAVVAGQLQDGLMDVLALVHRMAAATTSRVGTHLTGFDERAQGVITSALMAEAVLDRVEASSRRLIARLDEVKRATECLGSGVGAAKVEVQAASTAAEGWVENAGTLGRGVWWWALVGGVMGGVMSGAAAGLIQRVLAGL